MKTQAQRIPEHLDLAPILSALRKRIIFIGTVTVTTASLLVGLSYTLPKKYKSESQITIYTKYFQNPLVRELIPDQYDTSELRLQREALIHQAIDDTFLEEIGTKEKIFSTEAGTAIRTAELDQLRKDFEIFSLNGTTFQMNSIARDPYLAKRMGLAAMERVIQTLVEQRRKTLANARDAVRIRLESISLLLNRSADPLAINRPELLKRELAKVEEELQALVKRYKNAHPEVRRLRSRAAWIRSWLAEKHVGALAATAGNVDNSYPEPKTLVGGELEAPTRDVYQELLKKLNYLNVALEMERVDLVSYYGILQNPDLPSGSFAPKRLSFLIFGLAAGLLLSLFAVLLREYQHFMAPSAEKDAEIWGAPLLGHLPLLTWQDGAKTGLQVTAEPEPTSESPDDANRWN